MTVLAQSIKPTSEVLNSADGVLFGLAQVKTTNPFSAVIGMVIHFFEFRAIMKELRDISQQISNLQQDMEFYFQKVLAAVQQDTCYS